MRALCCNPIRRGGQRRIFPTGGRAVLTGRPYRDRGLARLSVGSTLRPRAQSVMVTATSEMIGYIGSTLMKRSQLGSTISKWVLDARGGSEDAACRLFSLYWQQLLE